MPNESSQRRDFQVSAFRYRRSSASRVRQFHGDKQMEEWTAAGNGARPMMMVLHDDADRESACGPADGLPDTKVGTFTQALYDEAKAKGWTVISMKNDWKRVFSGEK